MYALGSAGPEVRRIQQRLTELGCYTGPVDGDFGGGTLAAVRRFQLRQRLEADGVVGDGTWQALFGAPAQSPAAASDSLLARCLTLTGSFETGKGAPDCFCGISGDFDGQGISYGVLQWNFGQGTLQPLLQEMLDRHPDVAEDVFGDYLEPLRQALAADKDELMAFARSVQDPNRHFVYEPWRGFARALGRTPEFQAVQQRHAADVYARARQLCRTFALGSERAVALMFDIVTQNGSIKPVTQALIQSDIRTLGGKLSGDALEVRKMEIVANRRAEAASPAWVDDVRRRKLCIARGGGSVHGITYDLEKQFGIGLRAAGI